MKYHLKVMGNSGGEVDKLKAKQTGLTSVVEAQTKKVALAKDEYEKCRKEVEGNENATQAQKDALIKAQNELVKATGELGSYENQLKEVTIKLTAMETSTYQLGEAMETVGKKMAGVGDKLSSIGKTLTVGLTVPLAAIGTLAVKAAMEWESAFAGVKKTVDEVVDTNGNVVYSYDQIADSLLELSERIPATTTEIAGVAEAAGQLGIATEDVVSFTEVMINLGESTNLSAEDAASSLAKFANVTKMSAGDYEQLGSTIVSLGNNFATTEADIVNMAANLASAGTQVGMSQADIMALSTSLSSVGLEAQAGGTAFSKALINIQLAVETNSESLNDWASVAGMSASEFATAFKEDATGALQSFIQGLAECGGETDSAIKVLDEMGITETRMRDALLRSANASEIFTEAIAMGSGAWDENTALTEEASKRYETFESKLQLVKNQLNNVAIEIGGPLMDAVSSTLDALQPFIDKVKELAERFANASPETQSMIIKLGVFAAAAGPVVFAVGKLTTGIGGLVTNIGKGLQMIAGFGAEVGGLSGVIGGVTTFLTGPGGIVLAIVALVAILVVAYNKCEWFRDTVNEAFAGIKEAASNAMEKIEPALEKFGGAMSKLWGVIQPIVTLLVELFLDILVPTIKTAVGIIGGVIEGIIGVISGVVQVVTGIIDVIVGVFTGDGERVKEGFGEIFEGFESIATAVIDTVIGVFKGLWEGIVEIFSNIAETFGTTIGDIVNWFKELPGKIWDAIVGVAKKIAQWQLDVKAAMVDGIKNIIDNVVAFFSELPGKIITFLSELPENIAYLLGTIAGNIVLWVTNMVTTVQEQVPIIIDNVVTFFTELPGKIWDAIIGVVTKVMEWQQSVKEFFATSVSDIVGSVVNFFTELPGKIYNAIIDTITKVVQWQQDVKGTIETKVPEIISSVVNFFKELPQKIWDAIVDVKDKIAEWGGELVEKMKGIGADLLNGLWEGIVGIKDAIGEKISSVGSGFADGFKSVLGINSPSKIFAGFGQNMMQGLGDGVDNNSGGPLGTITNIAKTLTNSFGSSTKATTSTVDAFGKSITSTFVSIKSSLTSTITSMWSSIKTTFSNDISDIVKKTGELPKKLGDGLKNSGNALKDGLVSAWTTAVKGSAAPVNKALDGANWILGEFGSSKKVAAWSPYAQGTKGHPGGNALVNDGRGAELVQMPGGDMFIPQGRNVLIPNAPKGMKVLPAEETSQLMGRTSPTFKYASGIGNMLDNIFSSSKAVASKVKNLTLDVWDYIEKPKELIEKVLGGFVNYDGVSGIAKDIGSSMVSTTKAAMGGWVEKIMDETGGASLASYKAAAGVEQWRSTVIRALQMEGQYSDTNVAKTLYQMQTESGGNPHAINLWDSNAKAGIPSKGLMQVIDPTFNAYARSGFNSNIYDPLSNILASVRYAVSRYGSLTKAYRGTGYANGGLITSEQLAWVGEGNKAEMVIPLTNRTRSLQLIAQALNYLGGDSAPQTSDSGKVAELEQKLDRMEGYFGKMVELLQDIKEKRTTLNRSDIVDIVDEAIGRKTTRAERSLA